MLVQRFGTAHARLVAVFVLVVILFTADRAYSVVFPLATTVTGSASINGSLSKGGGSFMIDHPLDPKNKLLYHSFVESNEVKNLYDGIVQLDEDGYARVELPEYFVALNKDFRYLATPVGEPMPELRLESEVSRSIAGRLGDITFKISGGAPYGRVSWQVTGNRKDRFIQANPMIMEVSKGPEQIVDVGSCLHEPLCQ